MHRSARRNLQNFINDYVEQIRPADNLIVLELGSRDWNGHLSVEWPKRVRLKNIDISEGPNVDFVLKDPYHFPIEDDSVDVIFCSSVFEHVDFFWLSILECFRVLRPGGLVYINAPSTGSFHRYPVDSWRFYPDSARSLRDWGRRNGYDIYLNESFIDKHRPWHDHAMIFSKQTRYFPPESVYQRHKLLSNSDDVAPKGRRNFSYPSLADFVLRTSRNLLKRS